MLLYVCIGSERITRKILIDSILEHEESKHSYRISI